jgi:hypothetical protein
MEIQDRHDHGDALLTQTRPDGQRILRMGEADVQRRVLEAQHEAGTTLAGRAGQPISVRRLRWTDLPALSRIVDRHLLNQPGSSPDESDPFRTGVRNLWPFMRRDRAVFVALSGSDRHLAAFCQFRIVGPDQRWVMESAGVEERDDADLVVEEMTRYAVIDAGMSGVKRLYARIGAGTSVVVPLRQIGFAPYMRERILTAPAAPERRPVAGVRVQEQADVWSIHQLYMASTPRQVQYAEALTSHGWDVGAVRRSAGYGCRGWIVADDHLAVAYARAISRRDAHVLEFMVLPEQRQVLPDLLATAFAELSTMPPRQVYVVVREYQSESAMILLEQGFEYLLEQDAYVKYTTATARSSVMAASFAVEGAEPAAKRVPTFLHGAPDLFHDVEGAWRAGSVGIDGWNRSGVESGRNGGRSPFGDWSVD